MGIIDRLENMQLPCIYKHLTGFDCPGCGMQRAIIALLKGNFFESIKLYPPLLTIIIMICFLGLHIIFKYKYGAKILVYLFIINVLIISINFFYKILI